MAQTPTPSDVAAVTDILKQVYVSDNIESQLFEDAYAYSQIEKTKEYHDAVGDKAVGFVKVGRNVGVSSRSISQTNATKLGAAGHQKTTRWSLDYTATYVQVKILGPTIAKMATARQSAVREVDLEVNGAIEDAKKDLQRQLYTSGGKITAAAVNSATTTLTLNATDGTDAIVRGWLAEDMYIDIGSASDADSVAAERTITAVNESTPSITISGANVTTAVTDFISRAANRSPSDGSSFEMNGISDLVNDSGTFANINPSTYRQWKSKVVDASNAQLARTHLQQAYRGARQYGGKPDWILTSLEQQEYYYNTLQAQVRFASDASLASGKVDGPVFNQIPVTADPDCPRTVVYFLDKSHLFMVSAGDIQWQNVTTGGDVLSWVQDEDAFVARAAVYENLGTDRRRAHSKIKNLAP